LECHSSISLSRERNARQDRGQGMKKLTSSATIDERRLSMFRLNFRLAARFKNDYKSLCGNDFIRLKIQSVAFLEKFSRSE
jgi:hypothetical protein